MFHRGAKQRIGMPTLALKPSIMVSSNGMSAMYMSSHAGVTTTFYKNKIFVHIGVHIKMHIKL
jgi:hypothetical protein